MIRSEFEQLEGCYHEAVALSPSDRPEFLRRLRSSHAGVAVEVEAMLATEGAGIEEQVRSLAEQAAADAGVAEQIGPYRLLGEIGEGGFGVVYLAEQRQPVHRVVALKVIKPGMGTKAVLARFRQELQALEALDHPGIPAVLDAGETPDHRPFVVMPLVPGRSITRFCAEQNLPLDQRLRLMLDVCGAVQHAHGRGVIHRDLKPDNILVSMADGLVRPAVIDFGLAKALAPTLTAHTALTMEGHMVGTPEYMSPEQARGNPGIDVRTDVYSLGCIFYELLAGRPPFLAEELRAGGLEVMLDMIAEREPVAPSRAVVSVLPRELDWITLRCLEKSPERRYPTVEALAADLARYCAGESVQAGPPARAYRCWRWVARRRVLVAGVALALAGNLSGLVVAIASAADARKSEAKALRAAAESRESESEADQAYAVVRGILTSVDPRVAKGRDTELLVDALNRQSAELDWEGFSPRLELELREVFAFAYERVGIMPSVCEHAQRADDLIIEMEGRNSARRLEMLRCMLLAYPHEESPASDRPTRPEVARELLRVAGEKSAPGSAELIKDEVLVAGPYTPSPERCEQLIAHAERVIGPNSEQVIALMRILAKAYADRIQNGAVARSEIGRRHRARGIELLGEARRRAREAFGADSPILHEAISTELYVRIVGGNSPEQLGEAVAFADAEIPAAERVMGWRHPVIPRARYNLACLLLDLDRFDEAVAEFDTAQRLEIGARGRSSPMTMWIGGKAAAAALEHDRMDVFDHAEASMWAVFPGGPPIESGCAETIVTELHLRGDSARRDRWLRWLEREYCERANELVERLGIGL